MKIDCGLSRDEKIKAKEKWHLWFAWHPVRVGHRHCRWLENVWRKGTYWIVQSGCGFDWEYSITRTKPDTAGE